MGKYDLAPEIKVNKYEKSFVGYDNIRKELSEKSRNKKTVIAIECYIGVNCQELKEELVEKLHPETVIFADELAYKGDKITQMIQSNLTDDRVFGVMSHAILDEFFDKEKQQAARENINQAKGLVIIYGTGASLLCQPDILIYADLARWECQLRLRNGGSNWRISNEKEDILRKIKRGYFFEWRICDRQKQKLYQQIDYLLDTNKQNEPKMISGKDYRYGLSLVVKRPFRLVPYFDSSIWGGQWMKETFGLDQEVKNYGWAFDGVPEENSLYLRYGEVRIEIPAINVVHQYPDQLLGERVHSYFGAEFPIRFDYLDTMGGGNLSLQVHPLTEYIQDKFGMHYTQDESYYIMDAKKEGKVYLGVKEGIDVDEMIEDLKKAQTGENTFSDTKYVNQFPTKKHDHFLIPAGTVHCGGAGVVVLEISATPYIFTFKLWDWGRVGLDGKPRPVHLEHGRKNILRERNETFATEQLINRVQVLKDKDGHREERTGLHKVEFIETRRHWFTKKIKLSTHDSVNMLALIEGDEIVVESLDESFAPMTIHYGETFIVPEQIGQYRVSPAKNGKNETYAIIQAFVR